MSEGRKSKIESRKRFTDKQISFLEYMFETESRPELRMKHQLANKLGLHPRQVAIWFQNKRARSKSRQIEQEYNTLKLNYESLASKSESLKKENQALLNQLEMLRNAAERNGNSSSGSEESEDRINNERTENHEKQEIRVPFLYLGEESKIADIEGWEESLGMDLQRWLEF
ncbi:homeobox-leucine zipper protein ATHB-7 [Lactuca sativa]|uniref:Homeobox-leucine zipper protein n=1 Tax=Lactuca sativa TaxID=4236 RepID=A0A9R1W937_LACSA|nr:homeobox-leucine zipper protein ATHB-7 [Lactuca sativa]KAJ0219434.1 hypothetical protein LSAT_V11C300106720 [Lactuca sativa]